MSPVKDLISVDLVNQGLSELYSGVRNSETSHVLHVTALIGTKRFLVSTPCSNTASSLADALMIAGLSLKKKVQSQLDK